MSNINKINGLQITAQSASYAATASVVLGSITSASYSDTAVSASYALTASYALNGGGAGVTINNNTDNYIVTATGTANTLNGESNLTFSSGVLSVTGSVTANSFTGSLQGTSSYALQAVSASYAPDTTFPYTGSARITGSLTVVGPITASSANIDTLFVTNLTATTSSITYITSSQLDVGTNIITVNTNTSPLRFGGLAVADSGSSPIISGSLLFDSVNNQWIYVHQSAPAAAITSSVLIMGPQTFNNVGNETTITANRLTKGQAGDLGEHITSSNITDTGTIVSINSNTEITGSLLVSSSTGYVSTNTAELKWTGVQSVDWNARALFDQNASTAIDWNNRQLKNTSGTSTLNWSGNSTADSAGNQSIDWENRALYDASASPSVDWVSRLLFDGASGLSIDWTTRTLNDSVGSTILDWQNAQFNGNASTATSATSASFAITASYALNATAGPGGTDFGKIIATTQIMYPFSGF